MDSSHLLSVQDLRVTFDGRTVLENISFTIERGKTIAILGPNGSGKSTLLRALLGLVPYQGKVTWSANIKMAYVPQTISVDRSLPLTVAEFFALKKAPQKATVQVLRDVGLVEQDADVHAMLHRPLGLLSGGQLQRALIAWSIVDNPEVLLFDEPTSGIDIAGQQNIYSLLDTVKEKRGLTMLLISHDLHVVFAHADIVLCVNKTLTCQGIPSETLDSHALAALYGEHISVYSHKHHG